jgi:hypothetical protein
MEKVFEPLRIIAGLRARGVSFVLTGDIAAMTHGADLVPDRVEICVDQDSHIIERMRDVLMPLGGERTDEREDEDRAEYRTSAGDLECIALTAESFGRIRAEGTDVSLGNGVVVRVAAPADLSIARIASGDLVGAMRAGSLATSSRSLMTSVDAPVEVASVATERTRFHAPVEDTHVTVLPDEDEYGPEASDEPKGLLGKVMRGAEKVDRFMTRLNEGGGKRY